MAVSDTCVLSGCAIDCYAFLCMMALGFRVLGFQGDIPKSYALNPKGLVAQVGIVGTALVPIARFGS